MAKDLKKEQLKKAKKFAKLVKEGKNVRKHKSHTKVRFFRPTTLKLARTPGFARHISNGVVQNVDTMKTSIILCPVTTEKAMKKMEDEHTMVFMVKVGANKGLIKEAFQKIHGVKVRSVNTMITPFGKKKAYIRLSQEDDPLNLANKIGII